MDDTSTLRWILIICGAALLGGLLLFGNPNRKPKQRKLKRRKTNRRKAVATSRQEPALDGDQEPSRFDDPKFSSAPRVEPTLEPGQGELPIDDAGAAAGDKPDKPASNPAGPPPDKVVVLYLQVRDNRHVVGVELLEAAVKSGMEFGDMNIFHRMLEGNKQPLFSMANLEEPGSFDKDEWNTLETRGMTLFMGLPGPMPALDAWDALVATARRMSELLHLDILDSKRDIFTRHREGEIREELREFERQQQPEA